MAGVTLLGLLFQGCSGTSSSDDCSTSAGHGASCGAGMCHDGVQNGHETDVDCGGDACLPCDDAGACKLSGDCRSGICAAGHCKPGQCTDGVQNGSETDVDCGGGACPPCALGRSCEVAADCARGECVMGWCPLACSEGAYRSCYSGDPKTLGGGACKAGVQHCKTGDWAGCEGEVLPKAEVCNGVDDDCDGSVDEEVASVGMPCITNMSGVCAQGIYICAATGLYCKPNIQPESESCDGVDNNCDGIIDNGNFCCPDGTKTGAESDVDCGAVCPLKCPVNKKCFVSADCETEVCSGGVCQQATCGDQVRNGNETDIDCGGTCPGCKSGRTCSQAADCLGGACSGGTCQ